MTWPALGEDPAPGDVGAVLAVAERFRGTGDTAEDLASRLRGVDGAVQPAVWDGPAADSFRALLGDVGPATLRLAEAHHDAAGAVRRYADALEAAQEAARRAEQAAEQAVADRDAARGRQASAAADVAGTAAQRTAAGTGLLEARALRATTTDPAYAAQLDAYLSRTELLHHQARSREDDARSAERAAEAAVTAAAGRLGDARAAATRAAEDRAAAAGRLVTELGSVTPGERSLASFWSGVHVAGQVVEVGEDGMVTLGRMLVKDYHRGGKVLQRWAKDYGWLRTKLHIGASDVEKLEKGLGWAGNALGAVESGHEQWDEDRREHPGLSGGEQAARAIGGGLFGGGLSALSGTAGKIAGARAGAAVGGMIGSVVPGAGTVVGIVVGGAVGFGVSWGIDELEKHFHLDDAVRHVGADAGSEVYREITDPLGTAERSTGALLDGAADTAGAVWKGMTSWAW